MSSDAASGFGWIINLSAAVSEVCAPNKNVALLGAKLRLGNVSRLGTGVKVVMIATHLGEGCGCQPFILSFE